MFVDQIEYVLEACVFDSTCVEHLCVCLMLWEFGYTFLINSFTPLNTRPSIEASLFLKVGLIIVV